MKKQEDFEIVSAFVIFERAESKARCLHAMKTRHGGLCGKRPYPEELKFRTKRKLKVRQAEEPSSILWENYHVGYCSRIIRKSMIWIALGFFFIVAYVLAFALREYIEYTEDHSECIYKFLFSTPDSVLPELLEQVRTCTCKPYSIWDLKFGKANHLYDFCFEFVKLNFYYVFVVSGYGFGISILNFCSYLVVKTAHPYTRHCNQTSQGRSALTFLTLSLFANTALPLLLVNIDLRDQDWVKWLSEHISHDLIEESSTASLFFYGQYSTTSRAWLTYICLPISAVLICQWVF